MIWFLLFVVLWCMFSYVLNNIHRTAQARLLVRVRAMDFSKIIGPAVVEDIFKDIDFSELYSVSNGEGSTLTEEEEACFEEVCKYCDTGTITCYSVRDVEYEICSYCDYKKTL